MTCWAMIGSKACRSRYKAQVGVCMACEDVQSLSEQSDSRI